MAAALRRSSPMMILQWKIRSIPLGDEGVAGTLVVEKITGAAAETGADLSQLKTLGDKINSHTRSMGVALTSCTVPAAGKPTFEIGQNEMEMALAFTVNRGADA
jgi:phosphoenolpyruvate---glycerone phosphotransferase subunit DhaK